MVRVRRLLGHGLWLIALPLIGAAIVSSPPQESVLYRFQGTPDGSNPESRLLADKKGDLFGTTSSGGSANLGAVYELVPNGSTYTEGILYSFQSSSDGADPIGSLIADKHGALYGTTHDGGMYGFGTVFKLTRKPSGYVKTVLHDFAGISDGRYPFSGLIADKNGALYGTTFGGGSACGSTGCGTVFKLTPSGRKYNENVIYSFRGRPDGQYPYSDLIMDPGGTLYGTTSVGGSGCGVVFKLSPSGSQYAESILYGFKGGIDGCTPYFGLIADVSKNLYGTTHAGGLHGVGTVFRLSFSGATYAEGVLHSFKGGTDGGYPDAKLVAKGNTLYGTTSDINLPGNGTVFKINAAGKGYMVLYAFQAAPDGANPRDGVILHEGALLGTTIGGGTRDNGTAFKIIP